MPLSKLNYINVGPNGTFKDSGEFQTVPEDIDKIFEHLEKEKTKKLTIYFHGGLVNEKGGMAIAEKISNLLEEVSHPVTFVWETGLMETITRNLNSIHKTQLFQKILKYALKYAAKKLSGGIGGKGEGKLLTDQEVIDELEKDLPFDEYEEAAYGTAESFTPDDLQSLEEELEAELAIDLEIDEDEIKKILTEEAPGTDLLSKELLDDVEEDKSKGILSFFTIAKSISKIVYKTVKRYINKRDHGFYPTIVEEIIRELYLADLGKWVWDGIKSVADKMWVTSDDLSTDEQRVGAYFLDKLTEFKSKNPDLILDFVGHSAGAIAICNMMRFLEERDNKINIRNILFLAPACTTDLFYKEIVESPRDKSYEKFRMFTMQDSFEIDDSLVPYVYTKSLLYFISGVLESEVDEPLVGLDRHIGNSYASYNKPNLEDVHDFLHDQNKTRLALSVTDSETEEGLQTAAEKHQDFDDDSETQNSIKHIIELN